MAGVESTAPKSKPSVSHKQQPIDCGKEIERKRLKRKQMLLEEQQHSKGKSATHRLTEKTKASFSDEKYSVKKGRHTKKKNQKENLEKEKLPGQKALESASESTQEDSRDEESADSSEDEEGRQEEEETEPDVDNTSFESRTQKSKPSVSHTQKPKDIKKEIERKRSSAKQTLPEEQEHSKGKTATQRLTEETKTSIAFSGEKSIKSKGRKTEHRKITSQKEKLKLEEKEKLPGQKALESASESTQEDSQKSDGGSEDDRISEHLLPSKEEETEPDDESSTATSEEGVKVKKKPISKESESQDSTTQRTRKGKEKRVNTHPVDSLTYRELSAPGSCGKEQKEQEEHEMQPKKKRTRRNHGESSMSPIARGSSSPSTSQEDNQKQRGAKGQGKQKRKKKKERLPCSSEFDDSSPESDKVKNLPDAERKKLSGIFTCFFGELCCAVVDPVEIAAQLQKKSLISKATMIEILKSPESQRDKTIGLVSNLEKEIDSCPDCLFVLIEVLLQNEALQRAGNEMLREAGKY